MKSVFYLIFIPLFLSGQVSLETQLSKRTLRVGDQLNLTISVVCPTDKSVKFNELTPESDAMTVINEEISSESITYTLAFWEVGEYKIPGIPINILSHGQLETTLVTDPETVVVESLLKDENAQIREIKGMHEVWLHTPYRNYILLFIVIISGIALWMILRKRQKTVVKAEKWQKPADSPLVRAKKRLEKLECPYPVTHESCESYYLELTSIIKEFLENEFYFKAMEMTTEEINNYLTTAIDDNKLRKDTHQLLCSSDLSKFAKHIPEDKKFQNDKDRTLSILENYHRRIEKEIFTKH